MYGGWYPPIIRNLGSYSFLHQFIPAKEPNEAWSDCRSAGSPWGLIAGGPHNNNNNNNNNNSSNNKNDFTNSRIVRLKLLPIEQNVPGSILGYAE